MSIARPISRSFSLSMKWKRHIPLCSRASPNWKRSLPPCRGRQAQKNPPRRPRRLRHPGPQGRPPAGAVLLAHSSSCVQAFRVGASTWGLQFHVEATRPVLEEWCEAAAGERGQAARLFLRRATVARAPGDRSAHRCADLSARRMGRQSRSEQPRRGRCAGRGARPARARGGDFASRPGLAALGAAHMFSTRP